MLFFFEFKLLLLAISHYRGKISNLIVNYLLVHCGLLDEQRIWLYLDLHNSHITLCYTTTRSASHLKGILF